jgi:hypothetical protein
MENTPVVDEVVVPKKNVLFEVTTVSKVLATVLFVVLPFIGGWIGFIYGNNNSIIKVATNIEPSTPNQIIAQEINTEVDTTPEADNMNWVTTTASADGKEITIQYPKEIPLNITALAENKPFALGIDPGVPNYTLPLTSTTEILIAELTTDLKYIFYLKRDVSSDVVTLYKGTVSSKTVEKIADYNLKGMKEILDDQLSILMPLVTSENFVVYNSQLDAASSKVTGKITTTENNTVLFTAPCAFDRYGNVDFSPDKLHIVWNCDEDALYISDWKNTKKLLEYSESSMRPAAVSFINNERIKFANATEGNDMLRAPYHSVKIDGTDLKLEEGDVYLGY